MTPPPDEDNGTVDGTELYTPAHDEMIRKMIQEKLATLSPEEGRKWRERMLAFLTQEEIVSIQKPDDDGERG